MYGNGTGAKTLEGLPYPLALRKRGFGDKAEQKLMDTLGRRWVGRYVASFRKARERKPGEILVKAFAGEP
jgi:hypothetical protein